ncbi:MAG: FAD:protein FMN transferase, partial [Candidatus Ornithomonoglobus sp.]
MKYRGIISAIICSAVISGCSPAGKPEKTVHNDEEVSRLVEAMDTSMSIKAYGENAEKALDEAENEIMELDKKLRRGSGDSEIYTVNTAGCAEVSEETAELIRDALSISSSTDGAFDISIAPIMDLWGFYTGGYRVPTEEELAQTLDTVDYNNISIDGKTVTVSGGAQIDLGGIAKGYLSSRIMEIMSDNGVTSGIISLGGNVQALGTKTDGSDWRVAIQDPDNSEDYIGVVKISDMAVITSGGYQRF